ncbi:hypothetical protein FRC01_013387, partial [Tulasnella sp. 417]
PPISISTAVPATVNLKVGDISDAPFATIGVRLQTHQRILRHWWRNNSGRVIEDILRVYLYLWPFLTIGLALVRKRIVQRRRAQCVTAVEPIRAVIKHGASKATDGAHKGSTVPTQGAIVAGPPQSTAVSVSTSRTPLAPPVTTARLPQYSVSDVTITFADGTLRVCGRVTDSDGRATRFTLVLPGDSETNLGKNDAGACQLDAAGTALLKQLLQRMSVPHPSSVSFAGIVELPEGILADAATVTTAVRYPSPGTADSIKSNQGFKALTYPGSDVQEELAPSEDSGDAPVDQANDDDNMVEPTLGPLLASRPASPEPEGSVSEDDATIVEGPPNVFPSSSGGNMNSRTYQHVAALYRNYNALRTAEPEPLSRQEAAAMRQQIQPRIFNLRAHALRRRGMD